MRLADVARVELGAENYNAISRVNGHPGAGIAVSLAPGADALTTAELVKAEVARVAKGFPSGLEYAFPNDSTDFIKLSIEEVVKTLIEAIILVVIVMFVFLQSWRATLIPTIAVPVVLLGTFAVFYVAGFSINTLTLFGLVLAIGLLVDDAIVVVENVERYLTQGMSPKEAAHKTMDEVGGALIAISLVLIAVFLPTAFISGLQGSFYKQFAITIAASTAISCFVSLTLSPALAALLLKSHALSHADKASPTLADRIAAPLTWFFGRFNRGFEALSNFYGRSTARLIRMGAIVLAVYVGLLVVTGNRITSTPTGLIPQLDRSYFIAAMQLPPGSTLERADRLVRQASEMISATPGVAHAVSFVGFDGATFTNAPNTGVIFVTLKPFAERPDLPKEKILAELRGKMFSLREA